MSLTFVRYPLLSCSFDIMMLYNQSYLSLLHIIVQEAVIKTTPKEKKCKKEK